MNHRNLPHLTPFVAIAIAIVLIVIVVLTGFEREERQSEFGQFVTNKN